MLFVADVLPFLDTASTVQSLYSEIEFCGVANSLEPCEKNSIKLWVTSANELSGQIYQICGDEIEFNVDGEFFVACNACAFPVCRPCYENERREGNQTCPQYKTRYKRIKGSPRVVGDEDEDEDEFDDLEHEFDYLYQLTEAALSSRHNLSRTASGFATTLMTQSLLTSMLSSSLHLWAMENEFIQSYSTNFI